MANPVCLSPLKFYDAIEKQERYKSYAYGHVSPVIMPFNTLYPFQFVLQDSSDQIIYAYIIDAKTNIAITENIIRQLYEVGLTHKTIDSYTIVMFPGTFPLHDIKFEGEYYLLLQSNEGYDYYSEVFCFTNNTDDCLEIEYWNPEADFILKNGLITFANNFHFKVLLKSELGKPEYGFEEEATKRFGYNFIESQVSKKTYKFNTILPEYLCDAMRLIRLCSNKILRSKGEEYEMLSFDIDIDWQNQGDLASVNCEFDIDNIIVNLGGFKYEKLGGDYNGDFNSDFNI